VTAQQVAADPSMEVRLERIQATIDVGNTQTKGQLDLLMLRHTHSEQLADERERRGAAELKERDARLDRLESGQQAQARKLWFLLGGGSAVSVVANVAVQLLLAHR
jgi:hypothetical protein